MLNKLSTPSEFEIAQAESRLADLKKKREEAKVQLVHKFQSMVKDIPLKLSVEDAMDLYDIIEKKMTAGSTGHRKVRGHPVPEDLKKSLINALKSNEFTLARLERDFGVSVSYIAKLKKDLGLTQPRVGGGGLKTA